MVDVVLVVDDVVVVLDVDVDVAVLDGAIVDVVVVGGSARLPAPVSGGELIADCAEHAVVSNSAPTTAAIGCRRTRTR